MTGTNFSSWYRQDEGTVYAEMSLLESDVLSSNNRIVTIHAGDPTVNSIRPYITPSETISFFAEKNNNTSSVSPNNSIEDTTLPFKFAAGFAYEDAAACLDGGDVKTSSSLYYPTEVSQMDIGYYVSQRLNGYFRKLAFYPKRLPNATLQALTEE